MGGGVQAKLGLYESVCIVCMSGQPCTVTFIVGARFYPTCNHKAAGLVHIVCSGARLLALPDPRLNSQWACSCMQDSVYCNTLCLVSHLLDLPPLRSPGSQVALKDPILEEGAN
jgi:hypothetical protein